MSVCFLFLTFVYPKRTYINECKKITARYVTSNNTQSTLIIKKLASLFSKIKKKKIL